MNSTQTYSYSKISKFFDCPANWFATYIEKSVKFVSGPEAQWGNEVHEALDKHFKTGAPLEGRFASFVDYAAKIKNAAPSKVESEKELAFDGCWKPVGWWDKSAVQRGKIDVFYKVDDSRAVVLDHKTGKYKPSNYVGELKYFSLLSMKADPSLEKVKTVTTWLNSDSNGPPTVAVYDRAKDLPEIQDEFDGKIAQIERALEFDNFPMKVSGLCHGWCGNTKCKMWKPRK
jgi:hypothetical protein